MEDRHLDHVDYDVLDRAKNAFIAASKRTLGFAERFGFVPNANLGASANVFSLNLKQFLANGDEELNITLIPEGLGTADDARPDDLTHDELVEFWHNIAYKTASCMTNDAASAGMQPILLSLYLPSSTPEDVFTAEFQEGFLDGIVKACQQVGCVYFSGETPQLKNKIYPGKLDIAGAVFGLVPAGHASIDSRNLQVGDKIVMLASSGPHENGFTSFRQLAETLPDGYRTQLNDGTEYWRALNKGSALYSPVIQDILAAGINPTNVESISGHGWQKLMRPAKPFSYVIDEMLPVPEIFNFIQEHTGSTPEQMVNKFNYGAGYAVFVRPENADEVVAISQRHGVNAVVGGTVGPCDYREVVIKPMDVTLKGDGFALSK